MNAVSNALGILIFVGLVVFPIAGNTQPAASDATKNAAGEEQAKDYFELDLEDLLATPLVESASRRSQSQAEAPSTVTVLTSDDIVSASVTNIAEVFRKVPGVFVLQTTANGYQIGLRGVSRLENNRVLVLLDGRKTNERLAGRQPWFSLTVPADAIERIEVMRGPGSTVFGADALSGVVNIKTRRPLDYPGFRANLSPLLGTVQTEEGQSWLQNGGVGSLSYNWANASQSLGVGVSLGYSRLPDWPHDFKLVYPKGPHNYSARLLFDYRPSPDWSIFASLDHSLSTSLALVDAGMFVITNANSEQAFTVNVEKRRFLSDALTFKVYLDGGQIVGQNRPAHEDSYLQDLVETSSETVIRDIHTMLLLDWSSWDGRNILTLGLEGQYVDVDRYYVNPEFLFSGLILNNELHLLEDSSLILSVGSRFERVSVDDHQTGEVVHRNISPRLALVYKPKRGQALRLSAATSFRTPTIYESRNNVELRVTTIDGELVEIPDEYPGMRVVVPNPFLKPEQSYNLELAYLGRFSDTLRMESVLFGQRLLNPVGDAREMSLSTYKDNLPSLWMLGVELSCTWVPVNALSVLANYTFVKSWSDSAEVADRSWPSHLYYLGVEWRLPWRSRLNFDAYMVFDYQPELTTRVDQKGTLQATFFYTQQAADQAFVNLRWGHFLFGDQVEVFVALKNLLGFFREPDGLRTFPHEHIQPIGGLLMIGIQLNGGV